MSKLEYSANAEYKVNRLYMMAIKISLCWAIKISWRRANGWGGVLKLIHLWAFVWWKDVGVGHTPTALIDLCLLNNCPVIVTATAHGYYPPDPHAHTHTHLQSQLMNQYWHVAWHIHWSINWNHASNHNEQITAWLGCCSSIQNMISLFISYGLCLYGLF